uniref:Putative secreted protein n=1 Tax=Anopheles triannulatus TaxID=58253 RepID=A0A2M4B0N1_9DIPT
MLRGENNSVLLCCCIIVLLSRSIKSTTDCATRGSFWGGWAKLLTGCSLAGAAVLDTVSTPSLDAKRDVCRTIGV